MALQHLLKGSMPEVGKVKCGGKSDKLSKADNGNEYRMPVKFDHWVITTMLRDETDRLIADRELMDSLQPHADPDGKIRRLPVLFMSNDLTEILTTRYVAYCGKRTAAVSDGEMITEFKESPSVNKWLEKPNVVPHTPERVELWKMKLATTLNMTIPSPSSRFGGVYRFRTTSHISANQIYESLNQIREFTFGVLRGVPCRLVLRPMQVTPKGQPTTIYVAHVEVMGGTLEAIQAAAKERMIFELNNVREMRAIEKKYLALLAHEDDLDEDEVEEFFPEQAARQVTVLPTGEHVTASGEVIQPPADQPNTVPAPQGEQQPQSPPPPTATDKSILPETYSNDKKAMFALLKRKGQDWQTGTTWLNLKFKTGYTSSARWDDVPEKHRMVMAEMLIAMADNPKKG